MPRKFRLSLWAEKTRQASPWPTCADSETLESFSRNAKAELTAIVLRRVLRNAPILTCIITWKPSAAGSFNFAADITNESLISGDTQSARSHVEHVIQVVYDAPGRTGPSTAEGRTSD